LAAPGSPERALITARDAQERAAEIDAMIELESIFQKRTITRDEAHLPQVLMRCAPTYV
jgi:hypothetical protein